jgi:hypothetical protein
MSDSEDKAERFRCESLVDRGENRVLLSAEASKEFWALDTRQKARLLANMELWAEGRQMTDKQFNGSEGRAKGGVNRMLMAFKIHKIRCYGFVCPLEGRKTFVIVDVDPAKKTDKGKVRVLDRAKDRVVAFEKRYGESYE